MQAHSSVARSRQMVESQWLDDKCLDGAISRDLPVADHDIDGHPGPAKVPFPTWTSHFPSPDGLCFEVHYQLVSSSRSPMDILIYISGHDI